MAKTSKGYVELHAAIDAIKCEYLAAFVEYIKVNDLAHNLQHALTSFVAQSAAPQMTGKCQYVFKRGKKAGKRCNGPTKANAVMCSKHKNKAGGKQIQLDEVADIGTNAFADDLMWISDEDDYCESSDT